MATPTVRTLRPSWIAFGWFIAVAVTSFMLLALNAAGLITDTLVTGAANRWVALAFVVGFLAGGFFTGARVRVAPVLHGLGIAAFSVVVWLGVNLLIGEPIGASAWNVLSAASAATMLALQALAAVMGARWGARMK